MKTCLKLFKTIKLPVTESSAMLLRGRIPAKRLYFYSPFCLTYSSASNLFLSYSLCSLPLSPVNTPPPPVSLSLSLPLYPLSHYHSLVSWPGLVLTVLVSIRTLPLGCGPACVWSNGTEICSHSSSRSWWDFLQNISAPDVELHAYVQLDMDSVAFPSLD